MGNLEKLAVLAVLFLSAIVLAVSLSDSAGGEGEGSPFGTAGGSDGTAAAPARGEVLAATESSEPPQRSEPTGPRPLPLLDAGGEPNPPATGAGRSAETSPARRGILTSLRGLEPSFVDEYMEYTVAPGDTWSGLALRFYSDARMVTNLKVANDDLEELVAGTAILVPVDDLTHEAGERDSHTPRTLPAAQRAGSVPPAADTRSGRPSTERGVPTTYTVVSGDNLSRISKKVFGRADRWAEIYEANKAKLESPDWLTVGTKLRIPAAGEFAGAQPPPTHPGSSATSAPSKSEDRPSGPRVK